jgi:hypothetical protein
MSCGVQEKKLETAFPERLSQGVSPGDEPCDYRATVHCSNGNRWFCEAHPQEVWHTCVLAPGEEGGEA